MIIFDGLILSVVASVFIFATLRLNPRIWLQDYPRDVQARVPQKQKRSGDFHWLIFCTITPGFVVIPGSEGAEGYKNYGFHFRGFLIGTDFSAVAGLIIGAISLLL